MIRRTYRNEVTFSGVKLCLRMLMSVLTRHLNGIGEYYGFRVFYSLPTSGGHWRDCNLRMAGYYHRRPPPTVYAKMSSLDPSPGGSYAYARRRFAVFWAISNERAVLAGMLDQ